MSEGFTCLISKGNASERAFRMQSHIVVFDFVMQIFL
ncbi:hypothetical protein BCEN4_1380021 [Burkholderia cenocepacia]|nr:hypothetical protein BCEN4_1380021 [Burkholderia cenocepacia]